MTARFALRFGSAASGRCSEQRQKSRTLYLRLLTWAFAIFNSVRVVAYLPTILAIYSSGDSSQHSLWTWVTWAGANATMAAWLYEQNGQCANRAIAVSVGNAIMCIGTVALIIFYRI